MLIIFEQNGYTALIYASEQGKKEIVEMLLKTSNVDVNMKMNVCLIHICEAKTTTK